MQDEDDDRVSSVAVERSLIAVYTCCCVDMLGQAFTIATMPYFVRSLGGNAATVGLVISTWAGGNVISSMWMGVASDHFGRKPILVTSLVCSMIGFTFTGLAWDLPSLFGARLFLGLTSGSLPVAQSYIADVVSKKERANKMANLGSLNGLAVMVGPPIGSLVATTPLSLRGPFFVGAVIAVGGVLLAVFNVVTKEDLDAMRLVSPAARSQGRWDKVRKKLAPNITNAVAMRAGRTRDDARWATIYLTAVIAGLASMLNAMPAVLLALGPLAAVGLGQQTFGLLLVSFRPISWAPCSPALGPLAPSRLDRQPSAAHSQWAVLRSR